MRGADVCIVAMSTLHMPTGPVHEHPKHISNVTTAASYSSLHPPGNTTLCTSLNAIEAMAPEQKGTEGAAVLFMPSNTQSMSTVHVMSF